MVCAFLLFSAACTLLFCFFCLFVVVGGLLCTTSFLVCFLGWVLVCGLFAWSVLVVQVVTSDAVL